MVAVAERCIAFAGEHDGVYLFVTPSWTGGEEDYEITVDSKTWQVRCNCFGANKHHLFTDLTHPGTNVGCKHSRATARLIEEFRQKAHDQPPQESE